MEAFLQRYLMELDENLDDPHSSTRMTKAAKLRLLRQVEKQIWERVTLIMGSGGDAHIVETDYDLIADQQVYSLPGNFRKFRFFEQRNNHDRHQVLCRYKSVRPYDTEPGIEILNGQTGFRINPVPIVASGQPWTLGYEKGPVLLHYGTANSVSDQGLVGTPPDVPEKGDISTSDDYYKGCLVRVYSADQGAPQTRTVAASTGLNYVLETPWSPTPHGPVQYEICPVLPEDYDGLYALDAAIRILTRRKQIASRRELIKERSEMWNACQNYFLSNVSDRGYRKVDPYADEWADTGVDDDTYWG
jgi:hypothetical protein